MTTTDPGTGSRTTPATPTTGGGGGRAPTPEPAPPRRVPREALMLAAPTALAGVAGSYATLGPVGGTIATGAATAAAATGYVVHRRRAAAAAAAAKAAGKTPKTAKDLRREARYQRRATRGATRLRALTDRTRQRLAARAPAGRLRTALTPGRSGGILSPRRAGSGNGRPGSILSRAGRGNGRGTLLGRSGGRGAVPGTKPRGTSALPGSHRPAATRAPAGHTRKTLGGLLGRKGPGGSTGPGRARSRFRPGNRAGARGPAARTTPRRDPPSPRGRTGQAGGRGARPARRTPPADHTRADRAWARRVQARHQRKEQRRKNKNDTAAKSATDKTRTGWGNPLRRRPGRRFRDKEGTPAPRLNPDDVEALNNGWLDRFMRHLRQTDEEIARTRKGSGKGGKGGGTGRRVPLPEPELEPWRDRPHSGTHDGGTLTPPPRGDTGATPGETPKSDTRGGPVSDNYRDDVVPANPDVETAFQALDVIDRMAAQSEEVAVGTRAAHDHLTERVRWLPGVVDEFHTFSQLASIQAQAHRELQSTIHAAHETDIERIKSGTEADAAWDVTKNRGR